MFTLVTIAVVGVVVGGGGVAVVGVVVFCSSCVWSCSCPCSS